MVKKIYRSLAGASMSAYIYNDDYLDDILGDTEPYPILMPTEKA
jgi:hypothetical protein